jgi:hypothetical protein
MYSVGAIMIKSTRVICVLSRICLSCIIIMNHTGYTRGGKYSLVFRDVLWNPSDFGSAGTDSLPFAICVLKKNGLWSRRQAFWYLCALKQCCCCWFFYQRFRSDFVQFRGRHQFFLVSSVILNFVDFNCH